MSTQSLVKILSKYSEIFEKSSKELLTEQCKVSVSVFIFTFIFKSNIIHTKIIMESKHLKVFQDHKAVFLNFCSSFVAPLLHIWFSCSYKAETKKIETKGREMFQNVQPSYGVG